MALTSEDIQAALVSFGHLVLKDEDVGNWQ